MKKSKKVAITGASGSLAADIIPAIASSGWDVVGIDKTLPNTSWVLDSCKEFHQIDIANTQLMGDALQQCSAVIHLAGIPLEDEWERILEANISGTQSVLEASVSADVKRIVLASSIHAVGGQLIPVDPRTLKPGQEQTSFEFVSADVEAFPTTFYGVSKVALEALGQMYSFRFGVEVVCIRIASRFLVPQDERMLSTWLSPKDAASLMICAISSEVENGFSRVWGVSNNTRNYLSLDNGKAIGFTPLDDAEHEAPLALREHENDDRQSWDFTLGGIFSSPEPPHMPTLRTRK